MSISTAIDGAGLGASHQTGWTALIAELIDRNQAWAAAQTKVHAAPPVVGASPLASAKLGTAPSQP